MAGPADTLTHAVNRRNLRESRNARRQPRVSPVWLGDRWASMATAKVYGRRGSGSAAEQTERAYVLRRVGIRAQRQVPVNRPRDRPGRQRP